jgi:hypothetical protein
VKPFERDGRCNSCGREFKITGVALNPGAETEGPTRLRCACGGTIAAFVPGSVNPEKLVVTPRGESKKA